MQSFFILGIIGIRYRPNKSKFKSNKVEIIIVSIANEKVKNSLFECINHTYTNFPDIPISIIVDEGAQLIDSLFEYINKDCLNSSLLHNSKISAKERLDIMKGKRSINIIVVPKDYRPDLIAKGRSINYFVENHVKDLKWYIFIDDDNLILYDNFLYEIPFYGKRDIHLLILFLKSEEEKAN